MKRMLLVTLSGAVIASTAWAQSQKAMDCPMMKDHAAGSASHECPMMKGGSMQHDSMQHPSMQQGAAKDGMMARGDQAMGFSHDKTTHHFLLYKDGGAIEVAANDAGDTASRDQIREHLGHIAKMFAAGDFSVPMIIHAQNPPGVEIMQRHKDSIHYAYEATDRGARVVISTKDEDTRSAIHDFLRFQISDHQTGDSPEVAAK